MEVWLELLFGIRNISGSETGPEAGHPNFFHEDARITNFMGKSTSSEAKIAQLLRKIPALCGNQVFISAFTRAHHISCLEMNLLCVLSLC
jgi:hypothetical protein